MRTRPPKFIFVPQNIPGTAILQQLEISHGAPVLFLIAGADEMAQTETITNHLQAAGKAALAANAVAVDGGTAAGGMQLFNHALAAQDFPGAYVGFLPAFSAQTKEAVNTAKLGDYHSHFVLVEGEQYGDERRPMFAFIQALSAHAPAVGLVVNGGKRALAEVQTAVQLGYPLVVLQGSGRLADQLWQAAAMPQSASHTPEITALIQTGNFIFIDLKDNVQQTTDTLLGLLSSP